MNDYHQDLYILYILAASPVYLRKYHSEVNIHDLVYPRYCAALTYNVFNRQILNKLKIIGKWNWKSSVACDIET